MTGWAPASLANWAASRPIAPQTKNGDAITQTDMSVAHRAEGKVGRVETHRRLPGHTRGQLTHGLGPDVFLAEGAVGKDRVAYYQLVYLGAHFHYLGHGHIAQADRVVDALSLVVEDAKPAVEAAAGAGIAFKQRELGAVLGRGKTALDPHLARLQRCRIIMAKSYLFSVWGDQFSRHAGFLKRARVSMGTGACRA